MEILILAFRFLAMSQVLFFVLAMLVSHNPMRVKIAGIALSLGVLGYLLGPLALQESGLATAAIFWTFAGLTPSFVLFFTWVVFEERQTIPVWMIVLFTVDVVVETLIHVHLVETGVHEDIYTTVTQIKRLGIVTFALFLLWRGHECDLVERRIILRWWIIGSMAGLTFFIEFSHILTSYDLSPAIEAMNLAAVFVLCLMTNFSFLIFNPKAILVGQQKTLHHSSSDHETQRLLERMIEERLYADHDLRIASLADTLGLQEYQLRKKINQNLGYRNFNQFVNRYRIEEASQRLQQDAKLPVLTVALDVGFRSISSFNSAFQNHFGVSPTTYRKQHLAQAEGK